MVGMTNEPRWSPGTDRLQGTYRVSALDRLNNESQLSQPLVIH
jgi:hypothetical protein